jgi:hypothetical protein
LLSRFFVGLFVAFYNVVLQPTYAYLLVTAILLL